MNDEEIKNLQNQLALSANLIIDGGDVLMYEIDKLCTDKRMGTVVCVLLSYVAKCIADTGHDQIIKESIDKLPEVLKSYLVFYNKEINGE